MHSNKMHSNKMHSNKMHSNKSFEQKSFEQRREFLCLRKRDKSVRHLCYLVDSCCPQQCHYFQCVPSQGRPFDVMLSRNVGVSFGNKVVMSTLRYST
jgi:hypothetical protein